MAGLSCAQALKSEAVQVRVFDANEDPGGRMASLRTQTPLGIIRWDVGVQFFTAHSEAFGEVVDQWVQQEAVAEWTGRFVSVDPATKTISPNQRTPFVGMPSMTGLVRHMARDVSIDWGRDVSAIKGEPKNWTLVFSDEREEGPFEAVVAAVPAPIAAKLLAPVSTELAEQAEEAAFAPCLALLLAFEEWQPAFSGAEVVAGPISWISNNGSKPGRPATPSIVVHGSPDWSRTHFQLPKEDIIEQLGIAFFEICPDAARPVYAGLHVWPYARVTKPAPIASAWDAARGLGSCGDWHIGARVEAAWTSGALLAQKISAR